MPKPPTRLVPFSERPPPPPCLRQANNYACSQMRAYFKRMSVDPALKGPIYAEVEVDQADVSYFDL